MEERGGGSAIFISSIGGFQPIPFLGPYSVSKTALLGLTKVKYADFLLIYVHILRLKLVKLSSQFSHLFIIHSNRKKTNIIFTNILSSSILTIYEFQKERNSPPATTNQMMKIAFCA
jgi:short-subunit dehydrogenase